FARRSSRPRIGGIGRASRIRGPDSARSPPYLHAARLSAATEDTRSPKFEMISSRFARMSIFDVCDCLQLWNSFWSFSFTRRSLGLTVHEGARRSSKELEGPMSRSPDVRQFLDSWPYDPENYVRLERGVDGREIILVRLPMGLEEYEVEGRPDGKRVQNSESALEYQQTRLTAARNAGAEDAFKIGAADCIELFDEGTLWYCR